MKQKENASGFGWMWLILAIPFLDILLIRLIVLSIRRNESATMLFFLFILQNVPLEIFLRILFTKKSHRGWYYWASWICRWALILMAVFACLHLILGQSWNSLMLTHIYSSSLWADEASIPLRWISSICGMVLILGRAETRRKALISSLIATPVLYIALGIVSGTLRNSPDLSDFLASVLILLIPRAYALAGALFDPLFGKKIRNKAQSAASARSVRPPVSATSSAHPPAASPRPVSASRPASSKPKAAESKPAAPRDIEQELSSRKAAYEAHMRKMAAARKRSPEKTALDKMLEITADNLFNEGKAAAELSGRRQMVYWMIQASPQLRELTGQPAGEQFFASSLPDDPDKFLPLLNALLQEAAHLLESRDAAAEAVIPQDADPETLCAGWYAYSRFAAIVQEGTPFSNQAKALEAHFKKDRTCRDWLQSTYDSVTEGRNSNGPANPAEVYSSDHHA